MKLHIPHSLYHALLRSLPAAVLPFCCQAAVAQNLTTVVIPEGEEQTYTSVSDLENKHTIVDGSLTTNLSEGTLKDVEITVNETGVVRNPGVIRTSSDNQVTININGGQFYNEESHTNSISAQSSGARININIDNGGYFENASEAEAYVFNPYADGSTLQIVVGDGHLVNTGTGALSSEGPTSLLSITLNEGSLLENAGAIMGAAGPVQVQINGGELINSGDIYSGLAVYDVDLLLDIDLTEGKMVNNGFIGVVQWADATIDISEGTVLENNGQIQAQSSASFTINVKGGKFDNNGEQEGWLGSSLSSGGECLINVESGEFNNTSTIGNADVKVGAAGLMTGWGVFQSNDVSGQLVVGDGTPGLGNPNVKHQSYSGDFNVREGAHLYFYIETRENYSQIFVGGTATGATGIRAAVDVTSQAMAQSVADGWAFMNPGYVVQVDADGNETNVSDQLGIEYYGVGPYTSYYIVDPVTGSLLPRDQDDVVDAVLSGTTDLIDTLWSSTGAVQNFVRTALNQLTLPCYANLESRAYGEEYQNRRCRRLCLWGAGLGGFINMGGISPFTYSGGGYAVGADTALGANWRAGAAFGQSFGDFKAKHTSNTVDQEGIMFTVYGGYVKEVGAKRRHRASAYFAYGVVDNDARTSLLGAETGSAQWDDDVYTFGLEYAFDFDLRANLTLSPYVGLEYVYGAQSIFAESFSGGMVREYDGASMQVWRVPVGVNLRHTYSLGGHQYLVTDVKVGYVGDVSRRNPEGNVNIAGRDFHIKGSNPGRSSLMLKASASWIINDHWSTGATYNLEARKDQTSQGVNAYVRYCF